MANGYDITLTGDWPKIRRFLKKDLAIKAPDDFMDAAAAAAYSIRRQARMTILNQAGGHGWKKLAASTEAHKARSGAAHPHLIYLWYGNYYNGIKVFANEIEQGDKPSNSKRGSAGVEIDWRVGFKEGEMASNESELTLIELAVILEYGNPARNLPPRPLWRKVAKQSQRRIRYIEKKFQQRIGKLRRTLTYPYLPWPDKGI